MKIPIRIADRDFQFATFNQFFNFTDNRFRPIINCYVLIHLPI